MLKCVKGNVSAQTFELIHLMDVNGGLSLSVSQFCCVCMHVGGQGVFTSVFLLLLFQKQVYCIPVEAH